MSLLSSYSHLLASMTSGARYWKVGREMETLSKTKVANPKSATLARGIRSASSSYIDFESAVEEPRGRDDAEGVEGGVVADDEGVADDDDDDEEKAGVEEGEGKDKKTLLDLKSRWSMGGTRECRHCNACENQKM